MSTGYEDRDYIKRYTMNDINQHLTELHGSRYTKYRQEWELAGKGQYVPETPLHFFIELTSYCNLRCKMCYHSYKTDHEYKNMPLEMVEKIAEQVKEFQIPAIEIGSGSECLLHPEIKQVLNILKKSEAIDFFVVTNGHKLTEEISACLIDLQVERLKISLDAATDETYKKVRGASLEVVEENIRTFLRLKKEKKSALPFLRLSFVKMKDNIEEIDLFYNKWKDYADIIDFQDCGDLSHVDEIRQVEMTDFMCPHPFEKLGINCDGDLTPCCTFYNKYLKVGNINDMTLMEAWRSDRAVKLRQSFIDGNPPMVCKNCYAELDYRDAKVTAA